MCFEVERSLKGKINHVSFFFILTVIQYKILISASCYLSIYNYCHGIYSFEFWIEIYSFNFHLSFHIFFHPTWFIQIEIYFHSYICIYHLYLFHTIISTTSILNIQFIHFYFHSAHFFCLRSSIFFSLISILNGWERKIDRKCQKLILKRVMGLLHVNKI